MKTIAIGIQKGGTGKTTIAVSLAAELARYGSTLIIDADPQGNTTNWLAPPDKDLAGELAGVFTGKTDLKNAIISTETDGLYLLPTAGIGGQLRLYISTEAEMKQLANFKNLVRGIAKQGYKFCIIDLSPAFGFMERAAFMTADEIITPVMPDTFGMDGLEIFSYNLLQLKEEAEAVGMGRIGAYNYLVLNAIDHRIKQHDELVAKIKAEAKQKTFLIPVDQAFRRAQTACHPVQVEAAKMETLAEFSRMAAELARTA
jgi:chromosome partitioning protein